MQDSIERETLIAAPVERVWALITEPEHLGTWFGDAGAEVDLRPGGALAVHWAEHGTVHGRVEAVEAPHRFAWRWSTDGEDFSAPKSTEVEFTLAAEGDGTRLRVVERGFATLAGGEAAVRARFDDHTEGWAIEIGHLAEHAEHARA
ncbi:MAG: SRPBCC domain-containing protein [Solirubrobacterales bacterium]|nr:SRPBCC domain-containing protein [Solirubrobacterales bacterium]